MEEWNALHDAAAWHDVSTASLNAAGARATASTSLRGADCDSRRIGRRILAIRTLGHLQRPIGLEDAAGAARLINALVSFYAAAALVPIDAQRAMPGIMNQLAERESWPGEADGAVS